MVLSFTFWLEIQFQHKTNYNGLKIYVISAQPIEQELANYDANTFSLAQLTSHMRYISASSLLLSPVHLVLLESIYLKRTQRESGYRDILPSGFGVTYSSVRLSKLSWSDRDGGWFNVVSGTILQLRPKIPLTIN